MRRVIALLAACTWLVVPAGASEAQPSHPGAAALPAGEIVDLDFGDVSGSTVPDQSGTGNDGTGEMGAVGAESVWNPTTTTDSRGNPAIVFKGAQKQRVEIPDEAGSLNVNHFSILVQFSLNESARGAERPGTRPLPRRRPGSAATPATRSRGSRTRTRRTARPGCMSTAC